MRFPPLHGSRSAPQDKAAFVRLIGVSVLQSGASSILAPSLKHVGDALALSWRRRLTQAAHAYYLRGNNFYAVSQLAGMQVCAQVCYRICSVVLGSRLAARPRQGRAVSVLHS